MSMGTGAKPLERKPNGLSVVLETPCGTAGASLTLEPWKCSTSKRLASRWRWQHWRLELVGSRRYLGSFFAGASVPEVDISGYNRTPNERMRDPPYDWI